MMVDTKVLDLRSLIQKNEHIECIEDSFYICNLSPDIDWVNHPFKIDMCICCICSCGESSGRINLIPYTLRGLGMSINILDSYWKMNSLVMIFRVFVYSCLRTLSVV